MPTKAAVKKAAYDFLKAVAEILEARLGKYPKRVQRSAWMVHTGSGSMTSQVFTREIPNTIAASMLYQTKFADSNTAQQRQLEDALVKAGIPREETRYGYLLPLIHKWFDLPDPLAFGKTNVSQILDKFAEAVLDGVILTKSRSVILQLGLTLEPLILEKGICIRPISNEELWELGDIEKSRSFIPIHYGHTSIPSEDWKILDIEVGHVRERVHPPRDFETIRGAVLVALGLASSGHLKVFDLGTTASYGMGAIGTVLLGEPVIQHIGRWGGRYILDAESSKRLKALWPRIRRIISSERNYLRIPALRLLDGGGRSREDDAVVDYAIGLEALLLRAVNSELSYRFALRGATILAWDDGEKETSFNEFRDFYDIRSKIVHGSHIDPTELRDARSVGGRALRDIWWWYFDSGESLSRALKRVDHRILQ